MADTTLESASPESAPSSAHAVTALRTVLTFAVVLVILLILWQIIKTVFHFDSLTLPNVTEVVGALFEPIQEGQPILGTILLNHALFTVMEAVVGFAMGGIVGFALAVLFVHSRLLERGLLPFVVASQTVPILAVAPMVVVWLGPTASAMGVPWMSVSVIAAYLTFFPVTVNTLRGLASVPPTALELMDSYAATRLQLLIKLRIPHALPYIFTALKISATASIVGAIIGELSGIQDGLGYMILNFAQYYIQGPARLWATNLVAAITGILAFAFVAFAERLIVRWSPSDRKS